jgi:hypothetical protein
MIISELGGLLKGKMTEHLDKHKTHHHEEEKEKEEKNEIFVLQ